MSRFIIILVASVLFANNAFAIGIGGCVVDSPNGRHAYDPSLDPDSPLFTGSDEMRDKLRANRFAPPMMQDRARRLRELNPRMWYGSSTPSPLPPKKPKSQLPQQEVPAANPIDITSFVNMPMDKAIAQAKSNNLEYRFARIDQKTFTLPTEVRPNCLTFEVDNNVVTGCSRDLATPSEK